MPTLLTIWIAKAIYSATRAFGQGGGGALPGLVAERLNSKIGAKLARRLSQGSLIITGTNGKTTTSKILRQVLFGDGREVVANRAGSNLSRGVVSALIEHTSWSGRMREGLGVFEVDEAAMPAVAAMLQPKRILVLNLFRDQLDRYGELDTTAGLIGQGIAASQSEVYLNADDPLVAGLAKYAVSQENVHYFGLNDAPASSLSNDVTADSTNCPVCGRALDYEKVFFGHIGHYACREGHFDRPNPRIVARQITAGDSGSSFDINTGSTRSLGLTVQLPGVYNVYNALAATALGLALGIQSSKLAASLAEATGAFGRVEKVLVGGRELKLLLIKNPTGFNQIIQTFLLNKKQQKILFIINDNFADGRDVSWLWDVALEELNDCGHGIWTSGLRAADMDLRLKYAGVTTRGHGSDAKSAVNKFITQLGEDDIGYLIATYTAMREVRKFLGTKTELAEEWQ